MTTEVTPDDKKPKINAKVDGVNKRIRKKRRCRETTMTIVRSPSPVIFPLQRLYLSCLNVFRGVGTVPSPSGDRMLRRILDGLMPEDVGLPRNLQFLDSDSTVVYTIISQCQNFLLYVLFLPENAVIPLHNHPGMTVFSKLLVGKVHIKAYDLVNPDDDNSPSPSPSHLKLACLKEDSIFTAPCNTSVLYPTSGGNIHAFTAITPCAILDVVGPPFSKEDGRDCTYYKDVSHAISPNEKMLKKEEGKGYRWLEETEIPKELLKMDRMEYLGPKIIEVGKQINNKGVPDALDSRVYAESAEGPDRFTI